MSQDNNTNLEERAQELLEIYTNHPSGCDKWLSASIMAQDWDEVRRWVHVLEAEQAEEHFKNYDLVVLV